MALAGELAVAQQIPYATHDWTSSVQSAPAYTEAWTDIKKPGFRSDPTHGRQYAVGTIMVSDTNPVSATFSGASAGPATGLSAFTLLTGQRQVAILQITDANQGIYRQRYYYGTTPSVNNRACNARAISCGRRRTRRTPES